MIEDVITDSYDSFLENGGEVASGDPHRIMYAIM